MKKYNTKIKKLAGLLALTALFLNSNHTFGQHSAHAAQDVLVSYNTAFSYPLENNTSWELRTATGKVESGKGSLENYVFKEPGTYVLQIHAVHNPDACESNTPEKLNIKVSARKMEFDFSTVTFSENLKGGQAATGITVTVQAEYRSFDKTPIAYTKGFKTAGVDTTVTGKLKNGEVTLQQGVNTLVFDLEGQASTGNYIMLDFVDINGKVQSYGLTQIIE